MEISDSINYLITLEEDERAKTLQIIAPENSKSRDVYELELKKVLDNTTLLDTIEQNNVSINSKYVRAVRTKVLTSKFNAIAYDILEPWVKSKYEDENIKIAS